MIPIRNEKDRGLSWAHVRCRQYAVHAGYRPRTRHKLRYHEVAVKRSTAWVLGESMNSPQDPQEELMERRRHYIKSTAVDNAAASEAKDSPQIANNRRYVDWLNGEAVWDAQARP